MKPSSASIRAAEKASWFGNGGSRLTSTSVDSADGASRWSTSACRTYAASPSVQNTSPANGSAEAATVTRSPARRATFTDASMFRTA